MSGPSRCLLCGSGITGSHCAVCNADLDGATGRELGEVDEQLAQLTARRFRLLAKLGEEARATAPSSKALPGWSQLPPPPAPPGGGDDLPPFLAPYPPGAGHPVGAPPVSVAAGPQVSSILLTLGTALLVIAALVFAAVSWNRVGPLGQGSLLVGLTLAAGFGTHRAARRGLTGTAEALGVLTVLMGPLVAQATRITAGLVTVDDRTWANWGSWTWWPVAIMVIGAVAIVFGRAVVVRSPQWLGAALVQFGLPLWTALAPLPTWVKVATVAAQAGVVGSIVARRTTGAVPAAPVWWAGAVAAWFWAAVATLSITSDRDLSASVVWPLVGGLVALAVAAACVSWAWTDTPARRGVSAAASLTTALLAVVVVLVGSVTPMVAWPGAAVAGAVAAVMVARFGGRRRVALSPVAWVLVAGAALPAFDGLLAALNAAGTASDPVWGTSFAARPAVSGTADVVGQNPMGVTVVVLAVAAALMTVPGWWRRRAVTDAVVAGAGVVLLVAVPPLAGMSVGAITLLLLAGATLAVVTTVWPAAFEVARPVGLVSGVALLTFAAPWALGTQPLTMVAVAVAFVLAAMVVLSSLRSDDTVIAVSAIAVAVTAIVVETGLVVFAVGASPTWAVAASAVVAAAAVTVLPVGDASGTGDPSNRALVALSAAMASTMLHVGAVFVVSNGGQDEVTPVGPLTAVLAIGAASWTVAAFRGRSRVAVGWWAALAGAEALVLVWFRLTEASVAVLEAYTVPLALVVAGLAWLMAKGVPSLRESPSWSLEGPALALALWPTAFIALGDPGLTRQVVGLIAGAMVLAAGAVWRRRAPVDVGGVAVAVLGLQALLPYVAEVPRWISLGLVGIVLVALGATFEQRRRDFDDARRHYAALR